MSNEIESLKEKALESLSRCIAEFHRPLPANQKYVFFMLMGHACEMLLKAGILHLGGDIRKRSSNNTIEFSACINKALTCANVQFLSKSDAFKLRIIGALRNSAQHYYQNNSEGILHICLNFGLDIFHHVFRVVFKEHIPEVIPAHALPISNIAPEDIITLKKMCGEIKGEIDLTKIFPNIVSVQDFPDIR